MRGESARNNPAQPEYGAHLFLLEGDDTGLRAEHLHEIARAHQLTTLAIERLDGGALSATEIVGRLSTPSFFAPTRLFVVLAAQMSGEASGEVLKRMQGGLPEGVAVAWCVDALDRRRAANKWLAANAVSLTCKSRVGAELRAWLGARAKALDVVWAPGALGTLLEQIGEREAVLASELDKLALYVGAGGRVTPDVVVDVASHPEQEPAEFAIFRLVDALGERNARAALVELRDLLGAGQHPLGILAMIARQFRLIYAAKAQHSQFAQLGAELGVKEFQLKKASGQARSFTWSELEWGLTQLAECDRQLKLGAEGDIRIESLIVSLCLKPRENARHAT